MTVSINGRESVNTHLGVPQGMRTSPILFNIYIEEIGINLAKNNMEGIFFADDLVCVAEGRN